MGALDMTRPFFVMPQNSYDRIIENAEQNARQSIGQLNLQGSFLEKWLMPGQVQEREFGQQVALEKLQYEQSIDYKRQMEEMKKAGINPNLAAGGVAQSGSVESTPSVAQTPQGVVPTDFVAPFSAFEHLSNGVDKFGRLIPDIDKINSETAKNFADIGLTNAQTQGVITDNTYKDEDWRSRLNVQRQQFDNMKQEYNNMLVIHEQIEKDIQQKIAQADLLGSQADYYDQLKLQVEEQNRWLKALDDFRINHKLFINESGIDGYIWSMVLSGADISKFDDFIEQYGKFRGAVQYQLYYNQYSAESMFAYDISKARRSGENVSDILYGRVGSWADAIGRASQIIGSNVDTVVSGVSDAIKGLSKSKQGKVIRDELTMILNNAFDQLEQFPEDRERINSLITDLQYALSLSNKELIQWYERSNK